MNRTVGTRQETVGGGLLGTELKQDKENRADKEMEASTIGYNDNNLGSFIFLYAWAMFIFKSFREVKFYRTSVQSPHTGSGKHVSGWQNDARAWGWEAVSRRACRETARGVCGRSWDHASKGQGDRCLMAFLGGRCLRAEMCI